MLHIHWPRRRNIVNCVQSHQVSLICVRKACTSYQWPQTILNKTLNLAPMRLQNMMRRMQWHDFKVKYRKGREMYISDALSRAYLPNSAPGTDNYPDDSVKVISVTETKYPEIQNYTQQELSTLIEVIMSGWPDTRKETLIEIRQYWDLRDQLTVADRIIFRGMRIVIPPALRKDMLKVVHRSHLGIVKCKQRAREAMYWPGMNTDI